MMELLAVVDELFVTASLALLLAFVVSKLVEAINVTKATPKRHVVHGQLDPPVVSHAERFTVHPTQANTKVGFISPVHDATCLVGNDPEIVEKITLELVHYAPSKSSVVTECNIEEITVEPESEPVQVQDQDELAQTESAVGFISPVVLESERDIEKEATAEPVHHAQSKSSAESECKIEEITVEQLDQFATCVETEYKIGEATVAPIQADTCLEKERKIEEATVEPEPVQFGFTSPVQDDTCVGTEHNVKEATTVESGSSVDKTTQELDDSAEKRKNVESVEEIIGVERSTETELASVLDSVVKENDDDDDDDWEGIERSELEKEFMAATEFVSGDGEVGSDVKMELYGLHKVATEGPCREPQPMPLKLAARAKWNAWQKLGNMIPEDAMEQYISLLSDKFPRWMKDTSSAGMSEHEPTRPEVSKSVASDLSLSTTLSNQQMIIPEREQESDSKNHSPLTESNLGNNVKK